jgi:phosphoribosylglycinamide formyltransferase-1
MSLRIAVLISGNGSNLQAIIDAIANEKLQANIVGVISNKTDVRGLMRAQEAQIPSFALTPMRGEPREAYDERLANLLNSLAPDLIVLAGFMRILSPHFVEQFAGKVINIHPSLLPKYPGLHTHQQAIANQDKEHGCSIHFVTEALDGGPIIAQTRVPVRKYDTIESLQKRVHSREHKLYPQVIQWFSLRRIELKGNRVILNEIALPVQGAQVNFDRL